MGRIEPNLTEFARAVMAAASLRLDEIADKAREIIIFGSRATRIQSPSSDLDVLVVASKPGPRIKSGSLDMLWLRPEMLDSKWYGSELAGHVAAYGCWLQGSGDWKREVFASPAAVQKKHRQLTDRLEAFEASWNDLAPAYRLRLFTLIRRDLQRFRLLSDGQAVPPTPLLDREWQALEDPLGTLVRLLRLLSPYEKVCFTVQAKEFLAQ